MTPQAHEDYAFDLLSSLRDDGPGIDDLSFVPNPRKSRNASKAMEAIVSHRLVKNSNQRPAHRTNTVSDTTYDWKQGIFNCRNIADRGYLWTNMRLGVASEMHETAVNRPAAYLLACCEPEDTTMHAWALPEPLLHDSLQGLVFEQAGQKYTIQILTDKQRIERWATSPDLTPYYRRFHLGPNEMLLLKESRETDAVAKLARRTKRAISTAEGNLNESGAFDSQGIADARERVLSSIVRRRGQPAFRKRLLAAYRGRCAISGCDVEAVLDAAHILPYRGPNTNHPTNGFLLRTDLHTLFDLKLLAVDVDTMSLLISTKLSGTCYEEFRGRNIRIPNTRESRPSRAALRKHRQESGL